MKKRIQKYLSGSNEGFSLVELIIVIAIMAILVGVVALAVIPNLERSRESKDLATLDSACSALAVAVANAGSAAGDGDATIVDGAYTKGTGDTAGTVQSLFEEQVDPSTLKLASGKGTGANDGNKTIHLVWETEGGANKIVAYVGASEDSPSQCEYAKDAQGQKANLKVVGSKKTVSN